MAMGAGLNVSDDATAGFVPIPLQQSFWNKWNASQREASISKISREQKAVIVGWLERTGRTNLDLIEVGCGSGWLCPALKQFGCVTATDISDEVLARARIRIPQVEFIAGDFMSLDLGSSAYDVVVSVEVLSHVADQPAFVGKLADLIRPGGYLMLATQNRPVLERFNRIVPAEPGQLRRWVDRHELNALLAREFEILELFSITPIANRGPLRLVNSHKASRVISFFAGRSVERLMGKSWLGWTLMALARKR